jgi:hypothetical protein
LRIWRCAPEKTPSKKSARAGQSAPQRVRRLFPLAGFGFQFLARIAGHCAALLRRARRWSASVKLMLAIQEEIAVIDPDFE